MSDATKPPQAYILQCASGQWKYEIWIDGEEVSGGFGYADEFEATEAAIENNPNLEGLQMVVGKE